ncbi:MAG: type II secretion system F family protein [Synergistaceae bacterium]|jgi:type IV pilus assembly protein PilC|nr:type II secretion system F family protein [Synergistaceae bacterium]
MNFAYKARGTDGKMISGQVSADNQSLAVENLRQQGLLPLSVNLVGSGGRTAAVNRNMSILDKLKRIGTVPSKTKMVFFRQMATMIQAGLSRTKALDIVAEQEKNVIFRDALNAVKSQIDQGVPMSVAMRQNASVFNIMMISLVQAGEEGGVLDRALDRVATLLEKQQALKSKIKSAMFYPSFVICFAVGVGVIFIAFILPKFKDVFGQMGIELPGLTQMMFDLGDYCTENSWLIIGVAATVLGGLYALCTSKSTKPMMDRVKLKTPVIQGMVLKSALARSTQTLASLASAGVPILRGLEMAREVADNTVIQDGYETLLEAAKRGSSLGDASRTAKIFPILVCQMIRIGEETGHLDSMLERVAQWYEQELDEQIKGMTALLEPFMIVFVGGMVALIAMAIFGPITSAMEQMG